MRGLLSGPEAGRSSNDQAVPPSAGVRHPAWRRGSGAASVVLLVWVAVLLATQSWPSISDGVRLQFASDAGVYRAMATEAPRLPPWPVQEQHAERWVVQWAVGSAARASGVGLDTTYRAASLLVVAGVVLLLYAVLGRLRLTPSGTAVCLGIALASVYPFRYWLAAPGMVADAVFGLGLTLTLYGLGARRLWLVLAGLVVATAARQTAVPAAFALAVVIALPRTSFLSTRAARLSGAAAVAFLPLGLYLVIRTMAMSFSVPALPPLGELTVLSDTPRQIVSHVGRVVLGIAFPLAALLACLGRWRTAMAGPLALGLAIVVQPLILTSSWVDANEPRLAGLAVPALVVAAAIALEGVDVTWAAALGACVMLFLGSLHHIYSDVDTNRRVWVMLTVVGGISTFAVIVTQRRRGAAGEDESAATANPHGETPSWNIQDNAR